MADQTVVMSIERAGGTGFSGTHAHSGPAPLRSSEAPRDANRIEKPAMPEEQVTSAEEGDAVRLVRDEESGRSFIQILDRKTGEVLYQLPPEEVQKLAELLKKTTGSMVNTIA